MGLLARGLRPALLPAHKGARRLRLGALAGTLALVAGLAAGCNSTASTTTTTTTSTLPPLPPSVIAYVTLAGLGANLGFGNHVAAVNVTPGSEGIESQHLVGTYPDAIAIFKGTAYVANYTSNTVTPIVISTGTVLPAIPAGVGPAAIAISSQLDRAYVTDDGSATALGHTVTPIDLATRKPLAPIDVGPGPQGIAITPDGLRAYVADAGAIVTGQSGPVGNQVTPISLRTGTALRPITVGNGPTGIAVTPDGGTVYVTNLDSLSVTPIDAASDRPEAAIAVPGGPLAVVVAQGYAWVVDAPSSSEPGNNLVPISLATGRATTPIDLDKGAQSLAVTPNGATAWVACLDAGVIEPVDLATRRVGAPIKVPGGPFSLAITERTAGEGGSHPSTGTVPARGEGSKTTTSTG
ncbi:MAG: YncE family protein [Acidimicrobiales bacterium]